MPAEYPHHLNGLRTTLLADFDATGVDDTIDLANSAPPFSELPDVIGDFEIYLTVSDGETVSTVTRWSIVRLKNSVAISGGKRYEAFTLKSDPAGPAVFAAGSVIKWVPGTFDFIGAQVPADGLEGQVLTKASSDAFDFFWADPAPGVGGATNLSYTAYPTGGIVASDTGADATLPLADETNAGLMAPAEHSKLADIEANAKDDQTGAEIVAAINAVLGGTGWQGGASSSSGIKAVMVAASSDAVAHMIGAVYLAAGIYSTAAIGETPSGDAAVTIETTTGAVLDTITFGGSISRTTGSGFTLLSPAFVELHLTNGAAANSVIYEVEING